MMDDTPRPVGFLRRTVAPAVAIVILYASIRALPALLVNQAPPIDGGDLLDVFLASLVVFSALGLYRDYRQNRKGRAPSEKALSQKTMSQDADPKEDDAA